MSLFVGFVSLDDTLAAVLQTLNGTLNPVQADSLPTYRVYAPEGFLLSGTVSQLDQGTITNATNANPIVITSAGHGLTTGTLVTIGGVGGNTAANGTFVVTRLDANTFSIPVAGNGAYTNGGSWRTTGVYRYSIAATSANGFVQGTNYAVVFSYQIASTNYSDVHSFQVA